MGRNWTTVRRGVPKSDERELADARKEMAGEVRGFRLAEISKRQQMSREALADGMRVSRDRVSSIEREGLAGTELGTLQAYVAARGGQLTITADFPGGRLTLRD